MKNTVIILGNHAEQAPEGVECIKAICVLCDEQMWLAKNDQIKDDAQKFKDNHPNIHKIKYIATSCFVELNSLVGEYMIKKEVVDQKLYHEKGIKAD